MNTTNYYTPLQVRNEIIKTHNKDLSVENIRFACCDIPVFGFKLDFEKKGNRYFITQKGLDDLLHYFSPQEIEKRDIKEREILNEISKSYKQS